MIKLKDILKEASEGELIKIYKPTRFWNDFGKSLEKELKKHKMEATVGYDKDGNFLKIKDKIRDHTAHFPFTSRIQYVRSRTVQPRYHGSGEDDNQLLSIVRIFIKVLTDKNSQKVKDGEKINIDGIMTIEMMAEYNHSRGGFSIDESWCKWYHPFTGKVFEFDLGGGSTEGRLEDYIVKDIKFAVKKRANKIRGARYKVV
tara:strand:+ start:2198 stop:2800 length:603 start_codon:yes stop_codon:yes gene_type:complete